METPWTPEKDVSVTENGMVIRIAVDTIREEDLEIVVDQTTKPTCLIVSGHCDDLGSFETRTQVPSGFNPDRAKAHLKHGILCVEIPSKPSRAD